MNSTLRTGVLLALAPLLLATLAACTPTVAMTPAADATNPTCAKVIVTLPDSVADLAIRETDAQATSAYGNPTAVLLRCGVTPPGPTTAPCYTVNGVDWLEDNSGKPRYVFTTFGRNPAVQVIIDSNLTDGQGTIILDELGSSIGNIKQVSKCLNRQDVLGSDDLPTPSPTPTPPAG